MMISLTKSLRKPVGYAALFAALITAASWIKISFICGSHTGAFSLTHCLSPLIGMFGGGIGVALLLAIRTTLGYSVATAATSMVLACHIPTFCAGLYFSIIKQNKNFLRTIAALIPLTCMILFCIHPVGSQAWLYTSFWLIPVASASIAHRNLFFHALGSTFTAHAVGSVLWLYLGLVPEPTTWLALMPVVACERFLFGSGMVVCCKLISFVTTALTKNRTEKQKSTTLHVLN